MVDNAEFSVAGHDWQTIGAEICVHPDFPQQTNVEFVRIVSPTRDRNSHLRARRGADHLLRHRQFGRGHGGARVGTAAASPLNVVAPGGAQTVAWDGPGTELMLTGPAALIARGEAW